MLTNILRNFQDCLYDSLYNIKKNLWVAISYFATFLLGVILGIFFSDTGGLSFFHSSVNWFFDLFYIGTLFGALWRFLLTFTVFAALFLLFSQNRWLFCIGYIVILIRGFAFICSMKMLISVFSVLAIIFMLFAFLIQQMALLFLISLISSYYYCNNISIRCNINGFLLFLAVLCVLFAIIQCLLIFVILKPILLFV